MSVVMGTRSFGWPFQHVSVEAAPDAISYGDGDAGGEGGELLGPLL